MPLIEPEAETSDAAVPASGSPPGPVDQPAVGAAAAEAAAAAPAAARPPTAAARPLRPAPAVDDSIDLGATVLPVLVKSYAPYAAAALAGLLLGWVLGRRGS